MAKKIEGYVKLEIPAAAANPSPPVGPALRPAHATDHFTTCFTAALLQLRRLLQVLDCHAVLRFGAVSVVSRS